MFGSGLTLSVGNSLWACELQKKATLVLRTQSGCYVFSEVAGKPDCECADPGWDGMESNGKDMVVLDLCVLCWVAMNLTVLC